MLPFVQEQLVRDTEAQMAGLADLREQARLHTAVHHSSTH